MPLTGYFHGQQLYQSLVLPSTSYLNNNPSPGLGVGGGYLTFTLHRTLSHEKFVKRVNERHPSRYKILSPYKGNQKEITVTYIACGCTKDVPARYLIQGSGCKVHDGTGFWDTKSFNDHIQLITNGEYDLRGEFCGIENKVTVIHKPCGEVLEVYPKKFLHRKLNGRLFITKCPKCIGQMKTHTEFLEEVKRLRGDEYFVCTEYVNDTTKVTFIHNECGLSFDMDPRHFIRGQGCTHCFKNDNLTQQEVEKRILEVGKGNYKLVSKWVNSDTKITLFHEDCQLPFDVHLHSFTSFKRGTRCPNCKARSKPEVLCKIICDELKIPIIPQYRISGCTRTKTMPFDIAFFEDHEEVLKYKDLQQNKGYTHFSEDKFPKPQVIIEFHGEQHYKAIEYFKGRHETAVAALKYRQENDRIKEKFCFSRNIDLVIIREKDFPNVEKILINEFFPKYYPQVSL